MKKVIVIGCPGSGKSTFSKALHQISGLPLIHLDQLYWNADQTTVEKAVFLERLYQALQKEEWIIDGNYLSTMETRMQVCDTVIFLDYPTEVCLRGIQERKGKRRSDLPWIEPAEDDEDFLAFIHNFRAQSRPAILTLLERYPQKERLIFSDRDQAKKFLQQKE